MGINIACFLVGVSVTLLVMWLLGGGDYTLIHKYKGNQK
jgi:hypothetical protein